MQKTISVWITILFLFSATGCAKSSPTILPTSVVDRIPTVEVQPEITQSSFVQVEITQLPNQPTSTSDIENLQVAATTSTDSRLPPDRWQEWPIVPFVSETAKGIYQKGLELGNNPHAFSKVGDCQSVSNVFLSIYDQPDRYTLPLGEDFLHVTIDQFSGSFSRDSMAVKGGFNAATVFNPMWSDPTQCLSGENPLECEIRIQKPSIVIVSLETWFQGRTPTTYEGYIRRIVDYAIAHGVVPILATKADNVEGNNSINLSTAKVAYDYDIPLWNFWRAVQPLKDHGIDFARDPQGFHITTDAWNVRSYTALKAIDSVWKQVTAVNPMPGFMTPTPSSVPPSNVETASPKILMDNIKGKIVFSVANREGENFAYPGTFTYDPVSKDISNLLSAGYGLLDIGDDGKTILFNHGSYLYLTQLDPLKAPVILADDYEQNGENALAWIASDTNVMYTRHSENSLLELISVNPKNSEKKILISKELNLKKIFYTKNAAGFFWQNSNGGYYWFSMNSEPQVVFIPDDKSQNPIISPDNKYVAFIHTEQDGGKIINIAAANGSRVVPIQLPGTTILGYSWAPDSKQIAINMLIRSDYSGRWFGSTIYLVSVSNWGIIQLGEIKDNTSIMRWSSDGTRLLISGTRGNDNQYEVLLFSASILTKKIDPLLQEYLIKNDQYQYIPNLFWVN